MTCRPCAVAPSSQRDAAATAAAARRHGADGDSVELAVPVGTQVRGEEGELVADLERPGTHGSIVARGGTGGRGNARFATPTRQAPRFAETGLPGAERSFELRLKLVADAALAGLPNAGKSSLLRRISNATPKVADYPFTTLQPVLGTVEASDGSQLTVADVPGLIEGASEGIGLGHDFLAHLERARLLVHVIDASEGDADKRFAAIDRELALYGAGLDARPQIVVLNKADLSPKPAEFTVEGERILRRPPRLLRHRCRHRRAEAVAVRALPGRAGVRRGRGAAPRVHGLSADAARTPAVPDPPHPTAATASSAMCRTATSWRRPSAPPVSARARSSRSATRSSSGAVSVGVFGGAFDPPHVGHVELARRGIEHFGLGRLLVRVVEDPGTRTSHTARRPAPSRRACVRHAHGRRRRARPVRRGPWTPSSRSGSTIRCSSSAPTSSRAFLSWKQPQRVLELARLGVATRPGIDRGRLDAVLARLEQPERVSFFEIEPLPVSSSDIRARSAAGEPIDGLVPPSVAAEVARLELYRAR